MGSSPVTINPTTGQPQVLTSPVSTTGTATPAQASTATTALNNYTPTTPLPTQAQYSPTTINPQNLQQIVAQYYGGATPAAAAQVGNTQIGPASLLNTNQIAGITQGNAPDLSSSSTIQQILSGYQPAITQQNGQLANQLAEFGLSGGPAVAAQNNLDVQQTQAEAPAIATAIQNSQANQLNQGQFNSSAVLNALNANQGAQNSQNLNQAQLNQQAGLANQSATNSQSQLAAQLAQQAGLANADAANTANTANVGAQNSVLAANTSAQNAAQQAYLQQLQQQYLDQFSAFNSINDAQLGAQNQISVNGAQNFATPSTSDSYSGLGSALSSIYTPTAKTAPATTTA